MDVVFFDGSFCGVHEISSGELHLGNRENYKFYHIPQSTP